MKYRVTITEEYHRPVAKFFGLPKVERGKTVELVLTTQQADSLSRKAGVKVEPAVAKAATVKKAATEGGDK